MPSIKKDIQSTEAIKIGTTQSIPVGLEFEEKKE